MKVTKRDIAAAVVGAFALVGGQQLAEEFTGNDHVYVLFDEVHTSLDGPSQKVYVQTYTSADDCFDAASVRDTALDNSANYGLHFIARSDFNRALTNAKLMGYEGATDDQVVDSMLKDKPLSFSECDRTTSSFAEKLKRMYPGLAKKN